MLLRPKGNQRYQVIGPCFVHGLHDGIKLIGPLPDPWIVIMGRGLGNRFVFQFYNPDTGETTHEDPRLEPLTQWKRIEKDVDGDDPEHYDFFQHLETGEIINYDPRLEPEVLRARGVHLTTFSLV
jgi:hypothetical protein